MQVQSSLYVLIPDNPLMLPKNFRMQQHGDCTVLGSSQFSIQNLERMASYFVNRKVTVIDLRQETHLFLNGSQLSIRDDRNQANLGKSLAEVIADEAQRKAELLSQKFIQCRLLDSSKDDVKSFPIKDIQTEQDFVSKHQFRYIRYAVTDQSHPESKVVDNFIRVVKKTTPEDILLIHCEMGWGRTSTFLFMVDALKNAKRDSFETLIDRQKKEGADLTALDGEEWKIPYRIKRLAFVKSFYNYCREDSNKTWSEYSK